MKKLITVFILLFISKMITAQNLVPNGDFEQYWHCPSYISQIDSAKYWIQPTLGTCDYYNQCAQPPNLFITTSVNVPNNTFGFQQARSGVGYAGIYLWEQGPPIYREYIEVPLTSSLIAGTCYHFQMYINLANKCGITTSDVGVYFSNTLISGISNTSNLPFTPQINNSIGNSPDTLNWTLVSGNYTSLGGENYITIGNFKNDLALDTNLYNHSGNIHFSYIYIDDVSLIQCVEEGITNYNYPQINIFPNPITTQLTININNNEPTELTLYDITSRKILQQTFVAAATINTESLAEGIYLYQLKTSKGITKEGKVVK